MLAICQLSVAISSDLWEIFLKINEQRAHIFFTVSAQYLSQPIPPLPLILFTSNENERKGNVALICYFYCYFGVIFSDQVRFFLENMFVLYPLSEAVNLFNLASHSV